jgi:hypothetical protein
MKKNIILFASMLFMAYLTGCFIEVSFNIAEWQESMRFGVAIIGLIVASLITSANIEVNDY